jgi:hypothetical protein
LQVQSVGRGADCNRKRNHQLPSSSENSTSLTEAELRRTAPPELKDLPRETSAIDTAGKWEHLRPRSS